MRERLPDRRACETISAFYNFKEFSVSFGRYADGRLAEIFIRPMKASADDVTHTCLEIATVSSIALQYGVPLDVLRSALPKNADGSAAGVLGAALDQIGGENGQG